jgi:hypothetical protein
MTKKRDELIKKWKDAVEAICLKLVEIDECNSLEEFRSISGCSNSVRDDVGCIIPKFNDFRVSKYFELEKKIQEASPFFNSEYILFNRPTQHGKVYYKRLPSGNYLKVDNLRIEEIGPNHIPAVSSHSEAVAISKKEFEKALNLTFKKLIDGKP